jgi:hypothetical protein
LDDVPYLLKGRNARRAGGFGDSGLFGRKIEILGIRIGNARFVARLPGKPDEEPVPVGKSNPAISVM